MAILRYLFGLFRCHGTARQIIFSICIGAMIGILFGAGQSYLLFIPILLIFRLSLPYVVTATITFYFANEFFLREIAFEIGWYVLSANHAWTFFLEQISHLPGLVYFNLHTYAGLGSWSVAFASALILYLLLRIIHWGLGNSRLFLFFQDNKLSRKVKTGFWQDKEVSGNKILRPQLSIYILLLSIFILAFSALFSNSISKWFIRGYINDNLGLGMSVSDASLNVLGGKLLVTNLDIPVPESENPFVHVDFFEIDIHPVSLLSRRYVITNLNASGARFHITKKEGRYNFEKIFFDENFRCSEADWLVNLRECIGFILHMSKNQELQNVKMIEDYISSQTPKNPATIQTLLSIHNKNDLEKLLALEEDEILYRKGKPRYIAPQLKYNIKNFIMEKCQITLDDLDSGLQKKITVDIQIKNFSMPGKALNPTEINIKLENMDLANTSFLYKNSSSIWFESGKADIEINLQYDQHFFDGEGAIIVKNGQLGSLESTLIFNQNSRNFVDGLNKAANYRTPFSLKGNYTEWFLTVPEEPIKKVALTATSNLDSN